MEIYKPVQTLWSNNINATSPEFSSVTEQASFRKTPKTSHLYCYFTISSVTEQASLRKTPETPQISLLLHNIFPVTKQSSFRKIPETSHI